MLKFVTAAAAGDHADATLVDLLGQPRARIVDLLRRGARCVAELAEDVGVSEVAVRRHLQVLEREGLVVSRTVRRDGPGRPSAQYALTRKARRLFPDRSAEFANELLRYLETEHGRGALLAFLRWRAERHGDRYALAVADADGPVERADRLAQALSDDGFLAEVAEVAGSDGHRLLELRQGHCAVRDVAEQHPEICAYEAALFRSVLGAKVSRRQTIAGGAGECVCHIDVDTPLAGSERKAPTSPSGAPRRAAAPHDASPTTPRPTTGAHHGHES